MHATDPFVDMRGQLGPPVEAFGQLAEELTDPIANDIYTNVDRNTDYRP